MILYISLIAISTAIICLLNSIFSSVCFVEYGLLNLILIVCLAVAIVYVIDVIVAGIVTLLPSKIFKIFRKNFKWEKKFYEKLGIRKWKDLVPIGKGPLFNGMDKSKVEIPNDINFLKKLIDECFKAEIMHFFSMFWGGVIIFIYPIEWALIISLPVAIVNMILQYLVFIVQRYNLPKLEILLKRNLRTANIKNDCN